MKPTLSVSMDQRSNLGAIEKDHQIPNPAHSGESMSMPISEHISSQCVMGTEFTSSALLSVEGSDQKDGKFGLAESAPVPCCTVGVAPDKYIPASEQIINETKKAQKGQRKYKHKKEINLPRRASKRLAGIEVEPVPELKTRNRVRRVAVDQSSEGKGNAAEQFAAVEGGPESKRKFDGTINTAETPKSGQSEYSYGKLSTPGKFPEKMVEEHGIYKDQECFSLFPMENQATGNEHMSLLQNGDAKLDYNLQLPLEELLTDPCIAFAVQTLTGVTFETHKNSKICSEFMNNEHSETVAAAEGQNKIIKVQDISDNQEGRNVFSSQENPAIPKECAADAKAGCTDNANLNSGPSSEMPLDMSWMDPCIEFAIKTLTDSGTDPNSGNFLQPQLGSSNAQGRCGMAL